MGTYIKYPRVYNNIPIFIIARDLPGLAFLENWSTISKIYRVIWERVYESDKRGSTPTRFAPEGSSWENL